MAGAGHGNPVVIGVRNSFGVESVFPVFPMGLLTQLVPAFDQTSGDELLGYSSLTGSGYYFGDSD
jgi:hypothetical protein